MKTYTIDAKDKVLGRVASEVAATLIGKKETDSAKHLVPEVKVVVVNINDLKVTGNKMKGKEYRHYTEYPGGLRSVTMDKLVAKKGYEEIFTKAVSGMLPKNKLRDRYLKNLTVSK